MITPPNSPHVERLRAVLLVLAVWAVGFGLAAVLVCPRARRETSVEATAPCILLTVDPRSAGPVEAARVDTCPGDCTPTGAYCVRIIAGEDRP